MDQQKRESIIDAAAAIFAQHGFKKASIDDIAQRAGVAKGTVYLAADSKQDLFYEVLLREIRAWNAEVSRHIDPREPADQLLMESAERCMRTLPERPLVMGLMLGEMDHLLPELRPRFHELRAFGVTFTAEILRLGQRQGIFRKDLDLEEVASILLDLHVSTLLFHVRPEDPELEAKLLRRAAAAFDMILRGLRHATDAHSPPTQLTQ